MHIKRIALQGFKTYKEATVIDLLSPNTNVVVGRNGSGKSNFFAAIRFVLSDAYTQMSREERQGLIHEGSGTVMSAYVEIVFDNTDRRFPIEKDEIVIRRTIGLKKDDYSINHRSAQRSDIMNLLESAGFSRSNPYYIVPQGRITALTNAKDSERLQLLKEVAGAQVFEQKLKQSLKEMEASNKQREKIDEMLSFIEERLDDLNSEKEELKKFQEFEREKKFLEYTLYDREMKEIDEQIESIDSQHTKDIDDNTDEVIELEKREAQTLQIEELLSELKSRLSVLKVDKNQCDSDLNDLLVELAKQEEIVAELKNEATSIRKEVSSENNELKQLQSEIQENESKLSEEAPVLKSLKDTEKLLKDQLNELTGRQRTLYSKEGRKSQFRSRQDRDNWLGENIKQMESRIKEKKTDLDSSKSQHEQLAQQVKEVDIEISKIQDILTGEDSKKETTEIFKNVTDAKKQYSDLIDERKQLWRNEARQRAIIDSAFEELQKANGYVAETMDRTQSTGLESVKRIAERLGLVGVYGPLGELIEVNQKYKTAAEVIAGNSLFHVVVDNDNTASTIMEELVREKSGRVTFMPLNRLSPKNQVYPARKDCVPLIQKMAFDETYQAAVNQVYGKAVVTISLDVGSQIAREYKLTAITLDGDRADKKGVLTGGYRDHKRSRIDSLSIQRRRKHEYDEAKSVLHELKRKIEAIDQKITAANSSVSNAQRKYDILMLSKEPLRVKLLKLQNDKLNYQQEIRSIISIIESDERIISQYELQNQSYKDELESDFQKGLTSNEINELQTVSMKIVKLEKESSEAALLLTKKELELSSIESELKEKLYPRRDQLSSRVEVFKDEISESNQRQAQDKLKNIETEVEELTSKGEKLNKELEEISTDLESKNRALDKINDDKKKFSKKLSSFQKTAEKNISKKSLLVNRREDVSKKIRELGVLPEEAFTKFIGLDAEKLLRNLNSVNKKLTKYDHINRKALEQYLNFSKQHDELVERRKESDKSKESIENLIQVLEKRKNNAITRTFKNLSEGFSEIFEKLVPAGVGKLIMQNKDDTADQVTLMTQNNRDEDDDEIMTDAFDNDDSSIDNYSGISIQVSFNSKSDEQQRIEQLSGGQKSLCAIALILAIQKCDPAPFYLFDEIDANLDTQYRTDVAALIHKLSANAQFICTTFRPELLNIANKYYGIMYNKKISKVSEINKEEAMSFIEDQQQQAS
ncbi:cohesin subunit [Saccharomycopsis crataegensis]|uniref:Structural maintenance of chromosomes protein n=1 Tax=Saccharomycopsis crataegensis TaxID=43959 RepID=A0AAV5QP59_9ASCO|nr:cohesin subunit [Saccharomycopsis crataegensis]